jgi:hypothetical protein
VNRTAKTVIPSRVTETFTKLERRLRVAGKMLGMGFPDVELGHLRLSTQVDKLSRHLEKIGDRTKRDIESVFGDIELATLCTSSFSEVFSDDDMIACVTVEFCDADE